MNIMRQSFRQFTIWKNIPSNNVLVFPADLVAETANSAVLAAGLQAEHTQRLRNDNTLLLVVRRGNALKHLEALQGGSTASGLVRDHASNGLVEDARGSAEVERTWETKSACSIQWGTRRPLPPRRGLKRVAFRR